MIQFYWEYTLKPILGFACLAYLIGQYILIHYVLKP